MKHNTIGILGGLGPEATQLLFKKIIDLTPAKKDQEHIPMLIHNNPQIPDRTGAILYGGENPLPSLINSGKILEQGGASFIIIPCNTAHYYLSGLQESLNIPVVNMIYETANFIKNNYPDVKKVGLLATSGTVASKIYHHEFSKQDIEVITPADQGQEEVMEAIYGQEGIKAGFHQKPREKLIALGQPLIEQGADIIIAGCTEISIVLTQEHVSYVVIDPMRVLAEKAIQLAVKLPISISEKAILAEACEEEE